MLGKWHVQLPRVGWEEIGGLGEVKRLVQESVVWPFQHAEDFERVGVGYPKGVLLYGPPGKGGEGRGEGGREGRELKESLVL